MSTLASPSAGTTSPRTATASRDVSSAKPMRVDQLGELTDIQAPGGLTIEGERFLTAIRAATKDVHDRLDYISRFSQEMKTDVAKKATNPIEAMLMRERYAATYRVYLLAALVIESSFEAAIDDAPGGKLLRERFQLNLQDPRASDLIRKDIESRGGVPPGFEAIENFKIFSPALTAEAAAGLEYLRTGSRLGGKVLGSKAIRNLGVSNAEGATYLGLGGNAVKQDLFRLMNTLGPIAESREGLEIACTTARDAFLEIERWMETLQRSALDGVTEVTPAPVSAPAEHLTASTNRRTNPWLRKIVGHLKKIPGI